MRLDRKYIDAPGSERFVFVCENYGQAAGNQHSALYILDIIQIFTPLE